MSNHISSPRALTDPASNICDLYLFPSPQRPHHLVMVMTVFPRAGATALFSDAVICRFRLRPAEIAGTGAEAAFTVGDAEQEIAFDVTAGTTTTSAGTEQRCTCTSPLGSAVTVTINDRAGAEADGMRLFAGMASDPFIFQMESILQTLITGEMQFGKYTANTMEGANVLALVLEIDCKRWLPSGPLFALVAETLAAGKRPTRLERVGRPEVKNIGMQWTGNDTVNQQIDLRDLYNLEDGFMVGATYRDAYRGRLSANLTFYDSLDGKIDWPARGHGVHPLVDLLLDDYLVVDISKPFAEDSWSEIEQAMLADRDHMTCGGRALNDDFLDTYYTWFINAGNGPRISDGVDHATVPAGNEFPYLAPPNQTEVGTS